MSATIHKFPTRREPRDDAFFCAVPDRERVSRGRAVLFNAGAGIFLWVSIAAIAAVAWRAFS